MEPTPGLQITPGAAAELCRLSIRCGEPGLAHLHLVEGSCEEWALQIRAGTGAGVPLARADGITLHGQSQQASLLRGMQLDYRGDLSGGGFMLRGGDDVRSCACGTAFTRLIAD
ncbi:MAG: AIR synthase [Synechococcus sp. TMED19]|nr:MAG: AIR synthase [Synechococcus sp. TMED19]